MSLTTRHAFTDAFKREAVSLLEGSGRPLTQVAMELSIPPSMRRQLAGPAASRPGLGSDGQPGTAWRHAEHAFDGAGRDPSAAQETGAGADGAQHPKKAVGIFSGPPTRRDEIPLHRRPPRGVPRAGDVRGAGCISPSCWTCSPARWWAGPCARPCRRNQHWMRCAWRSPIAGQARSCCITPIVVASASTIPGEGQPKMTIYPPNIGNTCTRRTRSKVASRPSAIEPSVPRAACRMPR